MINEAVNKLFKQKIVMDLATQLGYHILQLAKLRMLQFCYDFLEKLCVKNSFEYIEMDTYSAYFEFAGKRLDHIVKPGKEQELRNQKFRHCNAKPSRHETDSSQEPLVRFTKPTISELLVYSKWKQKELQ